MVEPITAFYVQTDDDWTITVSSLGEEGEELTASAPGIIAARDRTDQLVEELTPEGKATVVHLLNGSALEFTAAYMTARLTLPETTPLEIPPSRVPAKGEQKVAAEPAAEKAAADKPAEKPVVEKPAAKPPLPQGKQLPKAIEARKPAGRKKTEPAAKVPAAKASTPPATAR
ncbi:hypothetical protein [Amycolatopsis sp.]|jgi:hypothetical protein|uniref:hypothetical protein n=1 Tax=Amycolatopsis sp. TaxID=37632 RepID=UPI002E077FE2|nr:hypothetical protein [Amycolatopsis sp.]